MAEIELHVLTQQCLKRRIGDMDTMIEEVTAWQQDRNNRDAIINRQFSTDDARIKLRRIYPTILD